MKRKLIALLNTGTNAIGRIKYNRYKLLTFVLAGLVIANAFGITGWTVNTITGLEINIPRLAWAAGASCEPDGECNADNETDCTANGCCSWEDDPGKGGDPFCYCSCDPDQVCCDEDCEDLSCGPHKICAKFNGWGARRGTTGWFVTDTFFDSFGNEWRELWNEVEYNYSFTEIKYKDCSGCGGSYQTRKVINRANKTAQGIRTRKVKIQKKSTSGSLSIG